MENSPYITHPSTAQQAREFTAQQQPGPASLSFPSGAGHPTPPSSEKDGQQKNGVVKVQTTGGNVPQAPNSPAATPAAGGATSGVSGIVPTLQ